MKQARQGVMESKRGSKSGVSMPVDCFICFRCWVADDLCLMPVIQLILWRVDGLPGSNEDLLILWLSIESSQFADLQLSGILINHLTTSWFFNRVASSQTTINRASTEESPHKLPHNKPIPQPGNLLTNSLTINWFPLKDSSQKLLVLPSNTSLINQLTINLLSARK